MNVVKRISAAAMVILLCLSFAGCHKKDETAVTVDGVKFTSAYYMCALIYADMEARSIVEENLDEEKATDDIKYYTHKVEKTDYVKWVEKKALSHLKQVAAFKNLCKKNDLKLDENALAYAEQYAAYYWGSGYSTYFEPNGVSQATYTQYTKDGYYSARYFEFLYGEDGDKEIAADAIKAKMDESFVLVDKIDVTFSEETDEEKAAVKEKFDGYVAALNDGSMTFEQVYIAHNGEETPEEETAAEDSEELKPLDKRATVLGAQGTGYESEQYDVAKAMAIGEVKLIEPEGGTGLNLIVKLDIDADPYYLKNLDMTLRHLIADEEYEKDMEKYAGKLEFTVNKYATGQFKVKKIKVPETQSQAPQA